MNIVAKMIKENADGSANVEITLDEEAKDFLLGEGFLAVLKRAVESSESLIREEQTTYESQPQPRKTQKRTVRKNT